MTKTMSNQERLYNVFSTLFGLAPADVNDDLSQDDIEQWDSFGMLNLVVGLEKEFNIQFDLLEIVGLKTVGIVKSVLIEKGIQFD